jgi:adenylate cyclase
VTTTPIEPAQDGLWTRLRRRKVVQWGLVYVAAAWGFLQGLEYVTETYHWPEQLRQVSFLALLIGLPIVLVLAWYHGDRGQQRISTPEFAILTLLLLLGGGAFWYYQRTSETATAATTAAQSAAPAAPPLEPAAAPDAKSIAVLPFADMSPAKDQEYMSDGIAEELLNRLANAPELIVIARTSSFAFKGDKVDIAEIARKLNVAHIVEGSVRASGDRLRITAQLIRTADRAHIWSQTYDRTLEDIFQIQDEIAGAIAEALQIKLMGGPLSRREGGTQNLRAYQLYLRAWNGEDWNTDQSLNAAQKFLEEAIALDSHFGLAWSLLASVQRMKVQIGTVGAKEGLERALQFTQHALELSPDSAHAHSSLSALHIEHDWDWRAAERESQQAMALDPNHLTVLSNAARLSLALGRWSEAEPLLRQALNRDPLNADVFYSIGQMYYRSGRLREAEATYLRMMEAFPAAPWNRTMLAAVYLAQGRADDALKIVQQEDDETLRLVLLPSALYATGQSADAEAALRAQIEKWSASGPYYIALSYAVRGDRDEVIDWLERAYEQGDPGLNEIVGEPKFNDMLTDARFKAFLRKMKLPEWHRQSIAATGT